jgi:hypothetical protein
LLMASFPQEEFPAARAPADLFSDYYWRSDSAEMAEKTGVEFYLTTKELKLMAAIFEATVPKVIREEIEGAHLPAGTAFDPTLFRAGTLVLVDLENATTDSLSQFGEPIEYDLAYPGQVSHLINCSAEELIQLQATRKKNPRYRPVQVDFNANDSHWKYSRRAWFGMIAPTTKGVDLISFAEAGNEPSSDLFQMRKNLAGQILRPAVVGQTAVLRRKNASDYQRLTAVSVFPESGHELARRVYKTHHSSKWLGRRAVRHLRATGLIGDTE